MRCQMTSYHDSTCGECLLSLSLDLVALCRTCGITGTQTALTWLEPNTASDVKRPNISRALIWRQWKSVICSAVCVPVHTTCDNQSFPILPEYAPVTVRWKKLRVRPLELGARVIKIMTLTRQKRLAPCRGHRDVTVCHYFFFHMV